MKTKPMTPQILALEALNGKRNFALLMEMGLGKTWTILADAERYFEAGKIDALVVLAPNGVHTNWIRREAPAHLGCKWIGYAWRGRPESKKKKDELKKIYADHYVEGQVPLRIFTMNFEALSGKAGLAELKFFLESYRCMFAIDESTRIKNPDGKRAKLIVEIGKLALCRRIMSGSPMPRSPEDLFMQFEFLKSGLLGTKSFRAFKAEYSVLLEASDPKMIAIMRKLGGRTWGVPQVVATDENGDPIYKNLDRLRELMLPHSFRATKEEFLDLPEKIYKVVNFELLPSQRLVYDRLKNEYAFLFENSDSDILEDVSFQAIAARTKMKQATSGFVNIYGEPVLMPDRENPRMSAFKEVLESIMDTTPNRQFIVWAMFKEELKGIKATLDEMGITCEIYNGDTSKDERERIIDEFQAGKIQGFIGDARAAGIGLTLTAATCAIYYSCSDDNELRMQSEDRCHRIGTKESVLYIDLIAEDTLDENIHKRNTMKSTIAAVVIDGKN